TLYPRSHYVVDQAHIDEAISKIRTELKSTQENFLKENKLLEAQRITQRTEMDLELIKEVGRCNGIENYSRFFSRRSPGESPPTLFEYFPEDGILFVDESHVTIPQLRAMYHGDFSRKSTLIRYGFRLPSALDNRPLKF